MRRRDNLAVGLIVVAALSVYPIVEWGSFPYRDLSAYASQPRSQRLDFIEQVLGEQGLPVSEKWVLEFVDRMLRGEETYKILELSFPTRDFEAFLGEAITTAYYAYRAERYARAPVPYREASRRLIRSWFRYPLGYGASGFHAFIDSLVEAEAPDLFLYRVRGAMHPDTHWTDQLLTSNLRWYVARYWHDQPIDGFLTMSSRDQANLIRWYWTMRVILRGETPDQDLLERVEEEWTERGATYVRRPVIRDLDRSTPFSRLASVALDEMVK